MNKENKITMNNLLYALLFLVFGMLLLTNTEDLITIASKLVGVVLILIGIVKLIIYIYMKGKMGDYNTSKLVVAILFVCCGSLFVMFSTTLSFVIRTILGLWVLLSGINRIIFAISIKPADNKSFFVYLITSILMMTLGIILISGVFDKMIGLLIIIYSVMEIVNYIYFMVKNKDYNIPKKSNKQLKKVKNSKKGKIVDAIIEEDKKD